MPRLPLARGLSGVGEERSEIEDVVVEIMMWRCDPCDTGIGGDVGFVVRGIAGPRVVDGAGPGRRQGGDGGVPPDGDDDDDDGR